MFHKNAQMIMSGTKQHKIVTRKHAPGRPAKAPAPMVRVALNVSEEVRDRIAEIARSNKRSVAGQISYWIDQQMGLAA